MEARIYKYAKTATQSGRAHTDEWVLEYESPGARKPEPLMGWTSAEDTLGQVRLYFPSMENAETYARKNGIPHIVLPVSERKVRPRNYGDNFRYRPEDEQ